MSAPDEATGSRGEVERDEFDMPERFAYLIEQARAEERKRIAQAIEAALGDFCEGCNSCDGNTRFGMTIAARIARMEPDHG